MLTRRMVSEQAPRSVRLRVVAVDLDGTLLRSDGLISARTRNALAHAEARGLTIMPITARPPRRVRLVAQATGLTGVAICSNGGLVYDLRTERVVRQTRLSPALTAELVARLREALPGVRFLIEAGLQYGCEPHFDIPAEHPRDRDDPHMRRDDALALCAEGVTKLIVQHGSCSLDALLATTRTHAGALASVTHSGSAFVEVAAASVTKALALEQFCIEHAIERAQVIAFGDMPNDLPMIEWAGRGVAVANAHPEVLAAADEITTSNDDDGVARVLERLATRDYVVDA